MGAPSARPDGGPRLCVFDGPIAQSEPEMAIAVHATYLSLNGSDATVIGREFAVKTHRTCGDLCRGQPCSFSNGFCQVPVYRHVPRDECRMFRLSAGDA